MYSGYLLSIGTRKLVLLLLVLWLGARLLLLLRWRRLLLTDRSSVLDWFFPLPDGLPLVGKQRVLCLLPRGITAAVMATD